MKFGFSSLPLLANYANFKRNILSLAQTLEQKYSLSLYVAYAVVVALFSLTMQGVTLEGQTQEQSVQALQPAKLPATLLQSQSRIVDADYLRVGLSDQSMQNQEYPSAKVSATGAFRLIDKSTGKNIAAYDNVNQSAVVTINVNKTGFTLSANGKPLASNLKGPIVVEPATASSRVSFPSVTRYKRIPNYRGYFEIVRGYSSPQKLSVVNVLPLQDYLQAVVPNELPAKYGIEAVRAQAVAARNYALRPRDNVWPQFDICDSQYCQAYYGAQTETPTTNKALEETEGLVALYDGDIALALYSSASGGYSESYSNAFSDPVTKQFPAPPLPYLTGGPDLPLDGSVSLTAKDLSSEDAARQFWSRPDFKSFDVDSPNYRWERTYTRQQLEQLLNANLRAASQDKLTKDFIHPLFSPTGSIGTLKNFKVDKRGVSGKAMSLEIQGSNGKWVIEKEFVIRKVLKQNNRMLLSANFVINQNRDASGNLVSIKLMGGGLGHGVGMSQLGASWMHKHGYGFVDIIRHYYKGVSLASIPLSIGGSQSQPFSGLQHTFFVRTPESAKLVIRSEAGQTPIYLALNGKTYAFYPSQQNKSLNGKLTEYRIPVGTLLQDDKLNSLVLFPDPVNPSRRIRAWVELHPAKPVTAQMAKR